VEQRKTRSTGMQKEFPLIPMRSLAKCSVARSAKVGPETDSESELK